MPAPPSGHGPRGPSEARAAIERFLTASRKPILLEPGEEPYPLEVNNYLIKMNNYSLIIQVWDERRHLARRVLGLAEEKPGKVELTVSVFPNREGKVLLADLAHPSQAGTAARGRRLAFRERFGDMLGRTYPDWKMEELSIELDLEHTLSGLYPRAFLRHGRSGLAAIGAPPEGPAPDGALSFGLIWLDYLRRRESDLAIQGLAVFLPQGHELGACLRVQWLDARAGRYEVHVYSPESYSAPVDPRDRGNVDTKLQAFRNPRTALSARVQDWVARLAGAGEVELAPKPGGGLSLRVHGLEFAWAEGDRLRFGIERKQAAQEKNLAEIEALARELARLRSPEAGDRANPLYRRNPERWLESMVRAHIEEIDAALVPEPVYGQTPTLAGGERGVVDLLAAERGGRLAVLDLKAAEDIQLPLQALDYWLRVRWHLERGEFTTRGYFPGIEIRREAPRLLLIAPALEFHPTTDTVLRFFSPEVPVERIGLGVEWRRQPKAVFRRVGVERDGARSANTCQSP